MKAVITIKQLNKKNAKVVVRSIENEDINTLLKLDIAKGIHNNLLRNFNQDLLVEVDDGTITAFYKTINSNNVVIEDVNKFDILKAIVPIPLNKSEAINRYISIVDCSERTARRHLREAINLNYIKEINHHNVVSVQVSTKKN
jgi:Fic family protein